jgi:hypothetical protein
MAATSRSPSMAASLFLAAGEGVGGIGDPYVVVRAGAQYRFPGRRLYGQVEVPAVDAVERESAGVPFGCLRVRGAWFSGRPGAGPLTARARAWFGVGEGHTAGGVVVGRTSGP